jgi:ABC-2 type transport system permease protein
MNKTWLVATHHFKKNVMKKSFIFVLLSVPLFLAFTIGMGMLGESMENKDTPIGYVDLAGIVSEPAALTDPEMVEIIAFGSEDQARLALDDGEIQAYYVIPGDYYPERQVDLIYYEEPGGNARSDFYDFMQINMASDQAPEVINRVAEGDNMVVRSPDGRREFPQGAPSLGVVLPLAISVAFIGLVLFSAGYMLEGVSEEKLNRTIEVSCTSLSPRQVIGGNVLGIVGISAMQLLTWILVAAIAIWVAANFLDISWFQTLELKPGPLILAIAIGIPTYITATALMLAVGSTIVEAQEGQALGFLFYMLMMGPLFAIVAIGQNPNGTLAVLLSLLPFTSLLTLALRNILTSIPVWQIALSIMIIWTAVLLSTMLAVRAFRLGMLRFGQRLRLNELINISRGRKTQEEPA